MDLRDPVIRKNFLEGLPHLPGVYVMRNTAGQVLYVGKSVDLHARVNSYFHPSSDTRHFVSHLPAELAEIEIWVTASEREALLLENNLIKELRPRYNVMLRDDKSYLMIRVDLSHAFPRFESVRGLPKDDGARYFGPYHSASSVRFLMSFLVKYFQFRTCSDTVFATRKRPCLQYHMERCEGPCTLHVDAAHYRQRVEQALLWLDGQFERLAREIKREMKSAAAALEFEKAARMRDLLFAIEKCAQPQRVVGMDFTATDAVGWVREGEALSLAILEVRQGVLGVHRQMVVDILGEVTDSELLSSFLYSHYLSRGEVPQRVVVPFLPDGQKSLETALMEHFGHEVHILIPSLQDASLENLLKLAHTNARHRLQLQSEMDVQEHLARLAARLHISTPLHRMECFDISHTQGRDTAASMAVFLDGRPAPKLYRQFHVRTAEAGDDYGALREVLARRIKRVGEPNWDLPDLMVIDGGRAQLQVALHAISRSIHADTSRMVVIALAKQHDVDGPPERVFLAGRKDPIVLVPEAREWSLLIRLRDEAHRFANRARRQRSEKKYTSQLSQISGLGTRRIARLMQVFSDLERLSQASAEDIARAGGFGLQLAHKIQEFLRSARKGTRTPTD